MWDLVSTEVIVFLWAVVAGAVHHAKHTQTPQPSLTSSVSRAIEGSTRDSAISMIGVSVKSDIRLLART